MWGLHHRPYRERTGRNIGGCFAPVAERCLLAWTRGETRWAGPSWLPPSVLLSSGMTYLLSGATLITSSQVDLRMHISNMSSCPLFNWEGCSLFLGLVPLPQHAHPTPHSLTLSASTSPLWLWLSLHLWLSLCLLLPTTGVWHPLTITQRSKSYFPQPEKAALHPLDPAHIQVQPISQGLAPLSYPRDSLWPSSPPGTAILSEPSLRVSSSKPRVLQCQRRHCRLLSQSLQVNGETNEPGRKAASPGSQSGRRAQCSPALSIQISANLMSTLKMDLCAMQPLPLIAPNKYPA